MVDYLTGEATFPTTAALAKTAIEGKLDGALNYPTALTADANADNDKAYDITYEAEKLTSKGDSKIFTWTMEPYEIK